MFNRYLFNHIPLKLQSPRIAFILLIGMALLASACSGTPVVPQAAASAATQASPTSTPAASAAAAATAVMPAAAPTDTPPTATPSPLKAYIGLFKDNTIAVLDTSTNQVLSRIPVPTGPHGLVITPDGRWVYASSDGDSKVSVIDTTTDKIVDTIEVGKSPHGLATTPDGGLVLAAVFGASQLVMIDTHTNAIIYQISVPSPHNIAISPDGQTAYIASQLASAPSLAIFDFNKLALTGSVPLTKVPRALNFSPDGKALYFTQAGVDAVQVLDPATNQIQAQIAVGASPHHPLFTPDGQSALVVSQGPGTLSMIDPKSSTVSKVVQVGKMPHWIAVNPQGTTAWVTNEASNDVSVVDLATGTVTATLPIGNAPRKIVVQPKIPAARQAPASDQAAASITISSMAFSQPTVTVKAGQPISWTNQDAIAHTVTADRGQWDSGAIDPGKSYSLTLNQPGQYDYHCSIHPFMKGTIIVTQ